MFGKFGSLLSFRGHSIGRHGATRKRRQSHAENWQVSAAGEQLESRALLTLTAGIDVNITQVANSQAEVTIAVNPTDPLNLIATANGGQNNGDEQFIAYSLDGGQSWIQNPLDAANDGITSAFGSDRFDAAATFDSFGNAHIVYMARNGSTGQSAMIYATSADKGISFSTRTIEPLASFNDKPWIATGPDASDPSRQRQAVLITYRNNVGLIAKAATVSGLGIVGNFSPNSTYSTIGNYGIPAVGDDGEFVVTWMNPAGGQGPASVLFCADTNGLVGGVNFGATSIITSSNAGGFDFIPATPDRSTYADPYLAYDLSNGPHRGRLYCAYADEIVNEDDNFEIFIRYSDNNGQTWSPRIRVNDDTGVNSQFFQSIAVDPVTGAVFMGWYDARNDLGGGTGTDSDNIANTDVEYFGSVSTDGGLTWDTNVRLSDGSSNQARDIFDPGNDFGDYTGVAAYGGTGYAVWADNSNSTGDNPETTVGLDMYFDSVKFNSAPTLVFTPDITLTGVVTDEDVSTGALDFVVTDDITPVDSLIVTATSSNQAIVSNGGLQISGTGGILAITATPVANASGTVFITVSVSDGQLATTQTFELRVNPTPDPMPIPPGSTETLTSFSDATPTLITDGAQIIPIISVTTPDTYLYDVNVTIDISHTRNSDLRVILISPSGTQVVLTSGNGADFDNVFTGTLFDDQAITTPVTDFDFEDNVTAEYIVPEGAMAQLLGEDPNGDWTLQIDDLLVGDTGTLNGWTLDLITLSAPPQLQANNGVNTQAALIPDATGTAPVVNGELLSVINLNGLDFFTWDVNLNVNISHTSSGDLDIYLISPSGTEIAISTGNGATFDNIYQATTFDDQGSTPVTDFVYANNVSLGTVIAEAALAGFVGENPNGNWTLKIVDHTPTGVGSLVDWSLDVTTIFFNDAPTIGSITNPGAIPEDSGQQTLNLNSISAGGGESQPLKVTAVSNNPGLIPNPAVTYTSPGSTGSLTYTPIPNQFGVAVITVTVEDGGYDQNILTTADNATTTKQVTVVVNPVNDAPTINPISNPPAILEDAGSQQLTLTGISSGGGENQPLKIVALSSNPQVMFNPTVEYTAGASTAILHYQSNLDYNGNVTVTVQVTDGGLDNNLLTTIDNSTTTRSFLVTITQVNDIPTLDVINNPTPITEDSPTQTIGLSGITPGGQETQELRITAASGNPAVVPDLSVNYTSPNSVGSLSFRAATNAFGTAQITVTVEDGGGDGLLSTTGDNATFQRQFTITITQLNDAPVFDPLPVVGPLNEDPGLQILNLAGISAGPLESQPLALTVASSNPALVPAPTVTYTSPNTTANVQYSVTPNTSGGSVLTFTLMDGGLDNDLGTLADNQTFTRQLVVTVLPVNDLPTLDNIPDYAPLNEDSSMQAISLTGISAGGGENQPIQIVATSNFTSIIPDPVVTYTSGNATGSLQFTPNPDQFGTVVISVVVTDGGLDGNLGTAGDNGVTTKTFNVTLNPVNDPPHFDFIADPPAVLEDSGLNIVDISGVTAGANETQQLQFTAFTTDPTIVPDPDVGYFQNDTVASLSFTPAPGQSGQVTVTLIVTDPGLDGDFLTLGDNLSYEQDFVLTINPINDLPTISSITNPSAILEDAGQQTINLTGLSSGDTGQVFKVTATSGNPALISTINVNHVGSNATGSLSYSPVANQSGTATITVTVTDGGLDNNLTTAGDNLTTSTTFNVQVNPVNDNPTLNSLGGSYDLSEDAGVQLINLTGITAGGGETQPIAVTVQSLNTSLVPTPLIGYSSPNSTGTLTFTPLANQSGSAILRIRIEDGGFDNTLSTTGDNGFTIQDLTVNVAQVNDVPTIDVVPSPQTVLEDSEPTTINLTGISGGIGEVQSVTVTAVSDNPSLIPDPVVIYVDGQPTASLTFTPAANQFGIANIIITVDDGDLQTLRALTVVVNPVNDAPTINSLGSPVTIDEDAPQQTVNFSGVSGGPSEPGQVFNVTVTSNNTAIIPNPTLVYTSGSSTGLFRYQPLPDQNGQVKLTVTITDGGTDNNLATVGDNLSTTAELTVNITPQPETPILTIDTGTLFVAGAHPTNIAPNAQLNDSDSDTFIGGSVNFQITNGAQSGDQLRMLAFGSGSSRIRATKSGQLKQGKNVIGSVTGGRSGVPLTISFTADIDPNTVEQIVRHVQFKGKASETGLRTVQARVTDNTNLTSTPVSRLVALT